MHRAGEEIIDKGFGHVVAITNYMDSENKFIVLSKRFIEELDFKLQPDNNDHNENEWIWKGFECMWCIQDGELQGLGIYVFFKSEEGADLCNNEYNTK